MYSHPLPSFPPNTITYTHTCTKAHTLHLFSLHPSSYTPPPPVQPLPCSTQSLCVPKPPNPLKLLFNSRSPALLSLSRSHTHRRLDVCRLSVYTWWSLIWGFLKVWSNLPDENLFLRSSSQINEQTLNLCLQVIDEMRTSSVK